jgi:putative membrane-bound dehydrogenase-like protein
MFDRGTRFDRRRSLVLANPGTAMSAVRSAIVLLAAVIPVCFPNRAVAVDTPPSREAAATSRPATFHRFTYLESTDPYYPHRNFPKLITPQWVGEEGVDAVVILAIDDMRDPQGYERYLRPILNRLKQIDGRAGLSVMTNSIDPRSQLVQSWLNEGLSIDIHTFTHPCPLLQGGDLAAARDSYDRCVDQMFEIPGNTPVAYRMPCCDSLNTVSPRFYSEIFNRRSPKGKFLLADSSVFNILTSNDPEAPRDLTVDDQGRERFRAYLPFKSFANTIEDYPYPYVIQDLCWQFPCVVPSDWSAQHLHGVNNPVTVRDWKAALDIIVHKKGVMNLVFHPHGWIQSEQVVELVDHAVEKHGGRVKFLSFREAVTRLQENFLHGRSLRTDEGGDAGIRLLDFDSDGYQDVFIPDEKGELVTLAMSNASPGNKATVHELVTGGWTSAARTTGEPPLRAAVFSPGGLPYVFLRGSNGLIQSLRKMPGVIAADSSFPTRITSQEPAMDVLHPRVRLIDVDLDGVCEAIVYPDSKPDDVTDDVTGVYRFTTDALGNRTWLRVASLPEPVLLVPGCAALRQHDIDDDGDLDLLFSTVEESGVWLWSREPGGWSTAVFHKRRNEPLEPGETDLPPFVRKDGTDAGVWLHSGHVWIQNEDTATLPDLVDRRSFHELLRNVLPEARSPTASLDALKPRDGFVVELMAAEPLTADPVCLAWDLAGRLWVAEMHDYPAGVDNAGQSGGRIRCLTDRDGDGRYDSSTVFLDNVNFPNGVMPYGNGVLVSAAPDIFYAEDTDGDGRADRRDILYTGFVEGNQQHRVNGFAWGLDNWIHVASGEGGGSIRSVKTEREFGIGGFDLKIRPATGDMQTTTGLTQHGRRCDDWGNWFGSNNSTPGYQFVIDDAYLRRNPHVALRSPIQHIPVVGGYAPVFPLSRMQPRFNDLHTANRVTSACSYMIYRDTLFGPHYAGNSFMSEPVHNLVHREVLRPDGPSFVSERAGDERSSEFLASRDNWFRPTSIVTGPDGALWVADMYREHIEHPAFIPPLVRQRINVRNGDTLGRIYRVYPVGVTPRPIPNLSQLSTSELVAALDSPSGWQRDTIQQHLVLNPDPSAAPLLRRLFENSENPLARLHALCTLDGLAALTLDDVRRGLSDPHPGVRRHAVRLAESLVDGPAAILPELQRLADDPDDSVVLQLACTLGQVPGSTAGATLARLARKATTNDFLYAGVVSSLTAGNVAAVASELARDNDLSKRAKLLGDVMASDLGWGGTAAIASILQATTQPASNGEFESWQFAATADLLRALQRRRMTWPQLRANAAANPLPDITAHIQAARAIIERSDVEPAKRIIATSLLGWVETDRESDLRLLSRLLSPAYSRDEQFAALGQLTQLGDAAAAMLSIWSSSGPELRRRILDELLSRRSWQVALLDAIESGAISPAEIDAGRRAALLRNTDDEIVSRSRTLFQSVTNASRQSVIDRYAAESTGVGDRQRGAAVFRRVCAQCHQLGGEGHAVGPDLAALTDRSRDAMLIAVFDPNRAVESKFLTYTVVTKAGKSLSGILSAETGGSITLRAAEGREETVPRSEVDELVGTSRSLMPEGLEQDLSPIDFTDLLAHVQALQPVQVRKEFGGNDPRPVEPEPDGSIVLTTATCEIYGQSLVLEFTYGNLGFWHSADDRAAWTIRLARPGRYRVVLDAACPNEAAGQVLRITAPGAAVEHVIEATGSWDNYAEQTAGELALPAGNVILNLQAKSPPTSAMLDLRTVRLEPIP